MKKTKNQEGDDKNDANDHVDEEHPQGELIGVGDILGPFHQANGDQVNAGGAQQGHAGKGEE